MLDALSSLRNRQFLFPDCLIRAARITEPCAQAEPLPGQAVVRHCHSLSICKAVARPCRSG